MEHDLAENLNVMLSDIKKRVEEVDGILNGAITDAKKSIDSAITRVGRK